LRTPSVSSRPAFEAATLSLSTSEESCCRFAEPNSALTGPERRDRHPVRSGQTVYPDLCARMPLAHRDPTGRECHPTVIADSRGVCQRPHPSAAESVTPGAPGRRSAPGSPPARPPDCSTRSDRRIDCSGEHSWRRVM
jgi:hypothetical protein